MDWTKVAQWLARYYEGDLSLEEEVQLREAMNHPDLPEEWLPERDYLLGSAALAKEIKLSDDFEAEFQSLLRDERQEPSRRPLYWLGAAAATVTLLLSVFFWPQTTSSNAKGGVIQFADMAVAEHAVNETQKSLVMLKTQLASGMEAMKYLESIGAPKEVSHLKKIDEVKQKLATSK
jgi:hypothetical protein